MKISRNDITKLFNNFSSMNIMVIGDVMIDSYLWGKVERISPEAPVPIVAVNKRENRLGGAANVAINLTSLGAVPILCSVIGNDQKSDLFREIMRSLKMKTGGIVTGDKKRITTTKFRIIGNNAQMMRVDEETEKHLSAAEEKRLMTAIRQILKKGNIHAIIFEDYDKGVITPNIIKEVTSLATRLSIPVIADPKKRNFSEYKNLTLFKPNLKELREGMKLDHLETIEDIEKAVQQLQKKNHLDIVMVTLSEAGVFLSTKEGKNGFIRKRIPAHIRNIADVSGAGDTVISVAALCLALKTDPEFMASLSNLAGGLVCEELGVVPVSKDKLRNEAIKMIH